MKKAAARKSPAAKKPAQKKPAQKKPAQKKPAQKKPARKPTRDQLLVSLKISPEVGWYLESRGIPLPDCAPLIKTPEPRLVPGAAFDGERVDRVLDAFKAMRHTQGKWAGEPLRPDPWQIAYVLAPAFGWVAPNDEGVYVRIIRKLYVEVPRKNGKSTLSGGVALYLTGADGEAGAQVIAAATTRDQAGFVFAPVKTLVQKSPALRSAFKAVGLRVLHPRSGSYFQAIANIADAQHGANIHGSIVDELHVHKSPDMVDALESGTGSRTQPLNVIITTADEGEQDTVYDQRHTKIELLAAGTIVEPSTYGVIFAAEPGDDPYAEATWRKANPGYGISPTAAFMRAAAEEARNSPADRPKYLRLHLGIRIKQTAKWLDLASWDVCGHTPVPPEAWRGQIARGGLDLSTAADLTAFVLKSGALVHPMFWLPEEQLDTIEKRCTVPLRRWVAEGHLRLTEGNVVDYARVRHDIESEIARLGVSVASIAYDPWNASETVQQLEQSGFSMVPVRQGYSTLSAPAKHLERLVAGSTAADPLLRHGGHPVLRWCADCVEVRTDDNGNIKPVKPDRVKSSKRIDGIVALIMAAREEMLGEVEESSAASYLAALSAQRSAVAGGA